MARLYSCKFDGAKTPTARRTVRIRGKGDQGSLLPADFIAIAKALVATQLTEV
ncbi:MAG: hypothetical protein KGM96_00250 [Acidobacteriota bacterium]|nr:hypothetical protein [Acidobacteriota bacterium]